MSLYYLRRLFPGFNLYLELKTKIQHTSLTAASSAPTIPMAANTTSAAILTVETHPIAQTEADELLSTTSLNINHNLNLNGSQTPTPTPTAVPSGSAARSVAESVNEKAGYAVPVKESSIEGDVGGNVTNGLGVGNGGGGGDEKNGQSVETSDTPVTGQAQVKTARWSLNPFSRRKPPPYADSSRDSQNLDIKIHSRTSDSDSNSNEKPNSDAIKDAAARVTLVDQPKPVGMLELFRFTTRYEGILNVVGLVAAVAAGAAQVRSWFNFFGVFLFRFMGVCVACDSCSVLDFLCFCFLTSECTILLYFVFFL